MNGSFNAYLLAEKPKLRRWKQHVTMNRNMMLQDDIKEFWGFYLLRGSIVKLSVCSRHEGASFIVVKGLKDARKCSYLGELDSQEEESDESSEEFEFSANEDNASLSVQKVNITNNYLNPEKMQEFLDQFQQANVSQRTSMMLKMMRILAEAQDNRVPDQVQTLNFMAQESQDPDPEPAQPMDDHGGLGGEDLFETDDDVYDLIDVGRFDQQDKDGKDKSREETRSSWSSSEEALMACEGLIFNVPLNGGTACTANASSSTLQSIRTSIEYEVRESGFYYFIFANENEMTDNFLSARFDLHKTVFDVSRNVKNCTGGTRCELPLTFWSEDHVVLEVPEYQPPVYHNGTDPCDKEALLRGYSSLQECHQILIAESVCRPRKSMYTLFLLLVPFFILFCAYI